ncbi:MAG: ATP-binding protein [Synechococcales bacterium]|nr:ATP-binding protein [Synechococcales bacterium]
MAPVDPPLRHILLIDDNPADRQLVTRELHRSFPNLEICEVGEREGFEGAIASPSFDLVITDYELNWSTGLEVLRRVKALDPFIPVVMFTASGSQEVAVEAMKSGLDDYVIKSPRHLIRLSQTVRITWANSQTRRRAEELDIRLRFLLNQLEVGVFRARPDGQLLEVNDGFLSLLGLRSFAEAETFFRERFGFDPTRQSPAGRRDREQLLHCPDGRSIWAQISETTIEQNRQVVIDGLVRNITERKEAAIAIQRFTTELESRVQNRTTQLEATNQELELLAYSLSHDLRSPIRRLGGFIDLLTEELSSLGAGDTIQDYLRRISRLIQQASRMIDDLLDYSRTGRIPMQPTPVDMDQLVQTLRQQVTQEQPQRNIRWQIAPLPTVMGDRSLLQRVWQNLIENAVTYTQPRDPAEILIGSEDLGDRTVFFIQDNGIGFSNSEGDRIFAMFQRLHSDEEFRGSGIGLASARRIIHRHGGQIWATGVLDGGATFYFFLPKTIPDADFPQAD